MNRSRVVIPAVVALAGCLAVLTLGACRAAPSTAPSPKASPRPSPQVFPWPGTEHVIEAERNVGPLQRGVPHSALSYER